VFQIHLVFYQFDDGYQQIGVTQPAEHVLESTQVLVGNAFGDAVAERGQYHYGNLLIQALDVACYVEALVISRSRHADDEVERYSGELGQCLLTGGYLGETWRIAQGKRSIFVEDFFVDASVVFQHESIIRISNQQDVENASRHEVGELRIFKIELV